MIDKLIEPVTQILDKFVVDKDLKAKLDHEIKTQFHQINLAQIEVNKVEASHRSIFVAVKPEHKINKLIINYVNQGYK